MAPQPSVSLGADPDVVSGADSTSPNLTSPSLLGSVAAVDKSVADTGADGDDTDLEQDGGEDAGGNGEDTSAEHTDGKGTRKKNPPRPSNAFILFSRERRAALRVRHEGLSNTEISQLLGYEWHDLDPAIKAKYVEESEKMRKRFHEQNPDYKYTFKPKKKRKATLPAPSAVTKFGNNIPPPTANPKVAASLQQAALAHSHSHSHATQQGAAVSPGTSGKGGSTSSSPSSQGGSRPNSSPGVAMHAAYGHSHAHRHHHAHSQTHYEHPHHHHHPNSGHYHHRPGTGSAPTTPGKRSADDMCDGMYDAPAVTSWPPADGTWRGSPVGAAPHYHARRPRPLLETGGWPGPAPSLVSPDLSRSSPASTGSMSPAGLLPLSRRKDSIVGHQANDCPCGNPMCASSPSPPSLIRRSSTESTLSRRSSLRWPGDSPLGPGPGTASSGSDYGMRSTQWYPGSEDEAKAGPDYESRYMDEPVRGRPDGMATTPSRMGPRGHEHPQTQVHRAHSGPSGSCQLSCCVSPPEPAGLVLPPPIVASPRSYASGGPQTPQGRHSASPSSSPSCCPAPAYDEARHDMSFAPPPLANQMWSRAGGGNMGPGRMGHDDSSWSAPGTHKAGMWRGDSGSAPNSIIGGAAGGMRSARDGACTCPTHEALGYCSTEHCACHAYAYRDEAPQERPPALIPSLDSLFGMPMSSSQSQ